MAVENKRVADYIHSILEIDEQIIISIKDLNLGNRSLTNDIDNVIPKILAQEKLNAKDVKIIYRDSEAVWDGYNAKTKKYLRWFAFRKLYVNTVLYLVCCVLAKKYFKINFKNNL